jgi:hypothetical protein
MSDIMADYREWRDQQAARVSTHSDRCHMWHRDCMIHRLAAALERAISGAGKSAQAANTPPEPSPASAGSQPVAWAVWSPAWDYPISYASIYKRYEEAVEVCGKIGCSVDDIVPLYRSPTLTDEEREAIAEAAGAYNDNDDDEDCAKIAATLRTLLERTGGER